MCLLKTVFAYTSSCPVSCLVLLFDIDPAHKSIASTDVDLMFWFFLAVCVSLEVRMASLQYCGEWVKWWEGWVKCRKGRVKC